MVACPSCEQENIEGAELCEQCGGDLTVLSRPRPVGEMDKRFHSTPVRELRPHKAVIVAESRKVQDVIVSLVMHQDGCAVVVDEEGKVTGIFSERDLILKVAGRSAAALDQPVRDFMTRDPVTIEADAPIVYALHQMDLGKYRHLPLVEDKKPVGMISVRDIITYIGDRLEGKS